MSRKINRNTFRNPILSGTYPDPSICRVGDDYYMVTSSFEYFPGVPVFHSRDLVNWRQLGHVLDRRSQLNLDGVQASRGIYAATIRYHEGTFYVITTFVENATAVRRNFYVTAQDPAGDWSDPVWLEDAPGIDPSIFFDVDGRAYYTGNRQPPEGPHYLKHMEIWLQELDLEQGKLVGPKYSLWDGAIKGIHAQEGPHLYRVGSYYYLFIAEGGTGFTHSVTVARSEQLLGPYETAKVNPVLTHRHLGQHAPIIGVGHADIVETQQGEWWMVCLGSRPTGGYRNLGREAFLVPMVWENEWPVVNPGRGIVEEEMQRPDLPSHPWGSAPACDHFEGQQLADCWNFIRTPDPEGWSLAERPGFLRLKPGAARGGITEPGSSPCFVGRRQQHASYAVRTALEFVPRQPEEAAGLVLYQSHDFHYRMEYARTEAGQSVIRLLSRVQGEETLLAVREVDAARLYLRVEADGHSLRFDYAAAPEQWENLAEDADGTILSMDRAGSFVGVYIGMYAGSPAGADAGASGMFADFDYFEYVGLGS